MCGINGIFAYRNGTVDPAELQRTRDRMTARGPDGCGSWMSADRSVGLAHRRLAIIDLSDAAAQPMATEDGRLVVSFNGEIYNHEALRAELARDGVRFRTRSDTEVLLHLYRRNGPAMLDRLRGMFAFAVWDEAKRELFLARDPYGIKPLYYSDDGRTFRFASQAKALLAGGAVAHEFDPAGVAGFFLWGSVPEPHTLYRDIWLVPSGSWLVISAEGRSPPKTHWTVSEAIRRSIELSATVRPGEEHEVVREALIDSVRAHMVADVPVGAFLSAGLDSSTLVGLAREITGKRLRTVTLTFEDFAGKETDELPLAREIATHLDVDHVAITLGMAEVEAELPAFFSAMDQPTIDGINTWLVSKATARAGLKVALSGLGGDELLGGYWTFARIPQLVAAHAALKRAPLVPTLYRILHGLLNPHFAALDPRRAGLLELGRSFEGAYRIERGIFMPWELRHVLRGDFVREGLRSLRSADSANEPNTPLPGGFARVMELESSRYMRNQLLRDTDWISMAHSLEVRVPLVDRELTERVGGLAATGRIGAGKSVLPAALSRPLPRPVLEKPKTGFTVPIWKWLRKSPELESWKRVTRLRNRNVHDYKRLAYSVFSRIPDSAAVLRA
ncbi:MAG: asparagine synthase (glutamine-hydrolyzing) [Rhodocyclaceae bacterium]